jgi:hypothetical protein
MDSLRCYHLAAKLYASHLPEKIKKSEVIIAQEEGHPITVRDWHGVQALACSAPARAAG